MKKSLSHLTDSQLQVLLKKKEQEAFEQIFERYWKRLYSYAYRIFPEELICEDCVQEVFISLWEKAADSQILNLEAYLLRAVKYKIANHLRDLKPSQTQLEVLRNIPSPFTGDQNLEYKELEQRVYQEIEKLPPKSREVFLLSRHENMSNMEISVKLNISKRTVETHISIALKHLRTHLDLSYYSLMIIGMFL